MAIVRSVAAVAVGYVFLSVPAWLPLSSLVATMFVKIVAAILAGWLSARIGSRAPFAHAAALAALVAALSIFAIAHGTPGLPSVWRSALLAVLTVACVLAGGALRATAARAGSQ